MGLPSVTSSETFVTRAQRSEATRVVLWMVVLAAMIVVTVVRRLEHGMVMSDNDVFFPYLGVLVAGLVSQVGMYFVIRRANRLGVRLPDWRWKASAVLDMAVALGLLLIAGLWSPRGPIPALSAPPLLMLPMVVLLSVLRLRPTFTLVMGLAGAVIHALLAYRAMVVSDTTPDPVYFVYSGILAMLAVAGMFVAREMRGNVKEAADEAAARERVDRQMLYIQRDLSVARDIQRGLLPTRVPKLAGFDIAGMNRPADETGGDYYDWQPLPDGRLAVALADVSGHGIGPALVMAVCRAYARATAPNLTDPSRLVKRLNELLHEDLPSDRFITFVVAVLDEHGTAQLISAGHGPTLLYRAATGQVTEFGGDGVPLGILPNEEYGPVTDLPLDTGDVLVMLTDGFFEWARPSDDEAFGIPRLAEALRTHASGDAASILRSIDETVTRFCAGSAQMDDMTAIVVKRTATGA